MAPRNQGSSKSRKNALAPLLHNMPLVYTLPGSTGLVALPQRLWSPFLALTHHTTLYSLCWNLRVPSPPPPCNHDLTYTKGNQFSANCDCEQLTRRGTQSISYPIISQSLLLIFIYKVVVRPLRSLHFLFWNIYSCLSATVRWYMIYNTPQTHHPMFDSSLAPMI